MYFSSRSSVPRPKGPPSTTFSTLARYRGVLYAQKMIIIWPILAIMKLFYVYLPPQRVLEVPHRDQKDPNDPLNHEKA